MSLIRSKFACLADDVNKSLSGNSEKKADAKALIGSVSYSIHWLAQPIVV
jgi:hypothetical protein